MIRNLLGYHTLGDTLICSSDDVTTTSYTDSYAKAKEILLAKGGSLRIKFDMKRQAVGGDETNIAYARIYKNGVAVGTEQTETSESYVTKSEDITAWEKGDLLQLYIHGLSSPQTQCSVCNLRVYCADVEVATVTQDTL
jgi:hypothetical protein